MDKNIRNDNIAISNAVIPNLVTSSHAYYTYTTPYVINTILSDIYYVNVGSIYHYWILIM